MSKKNKLGGITAENLLRIHRRQCPECGTPMENAVDSITGKVSQYLWKFKCSCFPANQQLCIG